VGVATITRHERLSIRGKSVTEVIVGLVLLLFFDHNINISDYLKSCPEKLNYGLSRQDTKTYLSKINKSRPRIRAALD
jgi:hypothetical protein